MQHIKDDLSGIAVPKVPRFSIGKKPSLPEAPRALLRDRVLYRHNGAEAEGFIVGCAECRGKRLVDIQPIDLDRDPIINLDEGRSVIVVIEVAAYGKRHAKEA